MFKTELMRTTSLGHEQVTSQLDFLSNVFTLPAIHLGNASANRCLVEEIKSSVMYAVNKKAVTLELP